MAIEGRVPKYNLECRNLSARRLGLFYFILFILSFTLVLHSLQLIYSNYKNNI